MKRTLAKAILIITEAGVDLLVEEIKKRGKRNGNSDGMDHFPYVSGAYNQRNRSTAHFPAVGRRRAMRKRNARGRSISKG